MVNELRPAPFVLVASNHGTMIINRNDYLMTADNRGNGVGYNILNNSCCDQSEVHTVLRLLSLRRQYFGDGVVAIDCGANIGTHTVEWGRLMHNWGNVWSFEAQEKIFYALAGNIILNNCLNVTARFAAVGKCDGEISITEPNYLIPSSFGSFELKKTDKTEFIGQTIDYDNPNKKVPQIALDSLPIKRLDLIKIDVEGMEEEVLQGAIQLIDKHKPIMVIEVIKSNKSNLENFLVQHNYQTYRFGINVLAIHKDDKSIKHIEKK